MHQNYVTITISSQYGCTAARKVLCAVLHSDPSGGMHMVYPRLSYGRVSPRHMGQPSRHATAGPHTPHPTLPQLHLLGSGDHDDGGLWGHGAHQHAGDRVQHVCYGPGKVYARPGPGTDSFCAHQC